MRRRKELAHPDIDVGRDALQPGEQRRQQHGRYAIGRADGEAAAGRGRIEGLGRRDDRPGSGQHIGDGAGEFHRARCRDDAFRRAEEQRIVEQAPESSEAMTYGRWGQAEPLRGAPDMPFFQDRFEENEEVEVGPREINLIQHIAEIIALDSVADNCDLLPDAGTARTTTEGEFRCHRLN